MQAFSSILITKLANNIMWLFYIFHV